MKARELYRESLILARIYVFAAAPAFIRLLRLRTNDHPKSKYGRQNGEYGQINQHPRPAGLSDGEHQGDKI